MSEIDWESIRKEALQQFTMSALPPTLKLPALPHAVSMFVQKSNNDQASLKELAAIIETDAGLTMELLRHVNSAYLGLRHKANSVQQALSLLWLRQSKMYLITTGMQAAVRAKRSKLINQGCFWNACLQKALFAKEVAGLLKTDTELSFAADMIQDYLLPVITNELFDSYINFIEFRDEQPDCICKFETEAFGFDHAVAAASLAHRWHLPDDLVCCILFHHSGLKILMHPQLGRSPVAAVAISALLPDQLQQDATGLDQLMQLEEKWPAFDLQALAKKVDETQDQQGLGMRNDFPLSRRCRPACSDSDRYHDGMLAVSSALA